MKKEYNKTWDVCLPCLCKFLYYQTNYDWDKIDKDCLEANAETAFNLIYCPWCGAHIKDKNPIQVFAESLGISYDQMIAVFYHFGEAETIVPYVGFVKDMHVAVMSTKVSALKRERLEEVKQLIAKGRKRRATYENSR